MKRESIIITTRDIENFRGDLTFQSTDFLFSVWDIFDYTIFKTLSNTKMLSLDKLISTKNQLLDKEFLAGEKQDPRQNAFELMSRAKRGEIPKREPLKVTKDLHIIDGNATAQVLMLLKWKGEVPVEIVEEVET